MNNENYFDKEVKAKAERYAEVPPPEVWERIRNKRKKRFAPFWIFLSENKLPISIALLTLIGGSFVYQNINKTAGDSILVIEPDKKSVLDDNTTDMNISYKTEEPEIDKIQNSADIKTTDSFLTDTQNSTNQKKHYPKKEYSNSNSLTYDVTETVVKHAPSQQKDFFDGSFLKPVSKEEQIIYIKDSIANSTKEVNASLIEQDSSLSTINHIEVSAAMDSVTPKIKSDSSTTPPPPVPDSSNTKWCAELMYGYDITTKKLTANGNQNYFNVINEHEKINDGFTVSLKIGYNLNPYLKLRSGFYYSYFSSEFNYEYDEQTISTFTGMINAYIISPFNSPQQITFYGTRIDSLKMSYAFNHPKNFRLYNIPIIINYYLPIKKFKFGAGAGFGFNLIAEKSGKYLHSDLKTESELSSKNQAPYKNSFGFYGIGNISLCFQLNKKIYLMAEPELRIPLSTITKTDAEIKQKINTISLQTGVGVNF